MPILTVRGQLRYDDFDGPTFCRFLPLLDAAPWSRLGETQFEVRVYVDPAAHRGWVTDIDLTQLDKMMNPSTTGLFVELRAEVDEALVQTLGRAFDASAVRAESHDFSASVLGALRRVHQIFIAFVRHDHMQYWLRPWEDHRLADSVDQRLAWYDARWQIPDGRWAALHPQCPRCQRVLQTTIRDTATLTKETWASLEQAFENGTYRAKPHRRLLANAFSQFNRRELRAAIVEAVAAWEMTLGTLVPARLAAQRVVLDETKWKALLEKAGLRAGTDLVIALAPDLFGACAEQVQRAVAARNNVIHNGATRLEADDIEQALWALRKVIANCEGGPAF